MEFLMCFLCLRVLTFWIIYTIEKKKEFKTDNASVCKLSPSQQTGNQLNLCKCLPLIAQRHLVRLLFYIPRN